jgi:RNA polymerase sigma-70 factor, ECF subfamily
VAVSPEGDSPQDQLYAEAAATFGRALERLARAYERDPDRRLDLLQEVHLALWRSFASFDGRCSLRTWVYRVAHNAAISQVSRRRSRTPTLVGLDELESRPDAADYERMLHDRLALEHVMALIHQLVPLDRQVILLYLEGLDAAAIADVTGISARHVATKVHRVKRILTRQSQEVHRD